MDVVRDDIEEFAEEHNARAKWLEDAWVTLLPQGEEWETDVDELIDEVEEIVDEHEEELPEMHVHNKRNPFFDEGTIRLLPRERQEEYVEVTRSATADLNDELE